MCLIAIAHRMSEELPLVIAANRDEFYDRPTFPAAPWPENPGVIGGRDGRAGGSWLAARVGGRFAAITNVRGARAEGGPSRGLLVSRFILGDDDALAFAQAIDRDAYAGFHLIVGDGETAAHVTNAGDAPPSIIEPGSIFAVSNGKPGEDWPKVQLAREAMESVLREWRPSPGLRPPSPRERGEGPRSALLDFLTTRRGGPLEQEVFVALPGYGTRSSTVITVDKHGTVDLTERVAPSGDEARWRLPSRS